MRTNDDFGFSEYIDTPYVEILPPSFSSHTQKEPKKKFHMPAWAGFRVSDELKVRASLTVLIASAVLFGSSVMIARSSDRLDQWRHHSLGTAQAAGLFMTVSAGFAFYFLGGKGDE